MCVRVCVCEERERKRECARVCVCVCVCVCDGLDNEEERWSERETEDQSVQYGRKFESKRDGKFV